jgi:hypothetical protein
LLLACVFSGVPHLGVGIVAGLMATGSAGPLLAAARLDRDLHGAVNDDTVDDTVNDDEHGAVNHDDEHGASPAGRDGGTGCGDGCGEGCGDEACSPVCQDCMCSLGARLLAPDVPRLVWWQAMPPSSTTTVLRLGVPEAVCAPPRAPALAGVFHPPRA